MLIMSPVQILYLECTRVLARFQLMKLDEKLDMKLDSKNHVI